MIDTVERETAAETAAPSPTVTTWLWCPKCKLASRKVETCPGCGNPYVEVPAAGVPNDPHMPKIRPDRTRRELIASLATFAAVFVGLVAAIFLLATHASTSVSTSNTPVADGGTVDGGSSYNVAVLRGTLHLRGAWTPGSPQLPVSLSTMTTGGAPVKTELGVTRNGETLAIGSFPSNDPASVLNQFVTTKPDTRDQPNGNKLTIQPSRDVSIAGYTAVAQDMETRNAKGGMISRSTLYVVSAGSRVVLISISAPAAQADDLSNVEQALVNIG